MYAKIKKSIFVLGIPTLVAIAMLNPMPVLAEGGSKELTLSEALDLALGRNPAALASRALHESSKAKISEAKSSFFPSLYLSAGYTKYQEENIIVPIHRAGVFPPLDDDIFESAAIISVPLFNGGRTGADLEASRALSREYSALGKDTDLQIISSVAQVFIRSQELEDKRRLVAARLDALNQRKREFSLLFQEGRISSSEMTIVESAIESVRSDSVMLESSAYELSVKLGQLTGADSPVRPRYSRLPQEGPEYPDNRLMPKETDQIPSTEKNPEVLKAQARLARAGALEKKASRAFWPEISGFSSYVVRSGDDYNPKGEWAVGVQFELPLFDGGRRLAAKRGAEASRRATEEQFKSVQQEQDALLRVYLDQWLMNQNRKDHLSQSALSKSRSVIAQRELYREGRIPLSELLTQETELLQLQITEREAFYSGKVAEIQYYKTSGILTTEQINTIMGEV